MIDALVIFDNGHGSNTPGKCSPDKKLLEYKWTREIVQGIKQELDKLNIQSVILVPEEYDVSLSERVKRANAIYKNNKNAFLISVHINAAGGDGKWHSATGFSPWVAKVSSSKSKRLAQILYKYAEKYNLKGNRCVPKEKYWTANFTIISKTNCPAVLTENLFQDNKEECDFLLSEKGKKTIIDLHVNAIKEYLNYGKN